MVNDPVRSANVSTINVLVLFFYLSARRPESAGASRGISQLALFPLDGFVAGDDQLGDAVAFFDRVIWRGPG